MNVKTHISIMNITIGSPYMVIRKALVQADIVTVTIENCAGKPKKSFQAFPLSKERTYRP
mgnify:CR=1 FL=1